jgi:predicted MFS family arabinose efflux permease
MICVHDSASRLPPGRKLTERVGLSAEPVSVSYSDAYKRSVVLLLMCAYVFNSIDRNIVSIIGQAMKVDLGLTDTQLGLLGGTAFAALYAFGGIPVARLAERFNRVHILTLSLAIWSGLTALAGAAGSFAQLLSIRAGVGIAEAGCSPPAYSLMSDYFEPRRRASAFSIYTCAISIGYLLAAVAGGYAVQRAGWRAACVLVGLPGIAMAVLIRALVREPPRGHSDASAASAAALRPPAFSLHAERRELSAVGSALLLDPPIRHMLLGVTISGFASYGLYAFVPPYFTRAFALDYATVGLIAGLTGGVAVGVGIALGGVLADRLASRGARWYALVPGAGVALSAPLYAIALVAPTWRSAAIALGAAGFLQYMSLGPTFGVVQNAVPARRRATAAAFLYICLSVVALGGGPVFVGFAIDRFAEHATLAVATRRGLLAVVLLYAWAAVHYFLAGRGLEAKVRASSVQSASM